MRITRVLARGTFGVGFALLLFELAARLLFAVRPLPPIADLEPYQMQDPQHRWHRVLRRNFVQTYHDALVFKHETHRVLGEQYLLGLHAEPSQPFVRINADGFRGPEIDGGHQRVRILTVGDSCTFGRDESSSYPRMLERRLREMVAPVEVVNAGVEGYMARDVLIEMERLKKLKPDIATVYLGWNGLYDDESMFGRPMLASVRLVRGAWRAARADAFAEYQREKRLDPSAPDLANVAHMTPAFFGQIRQIVRDLKQGGSQVVVFTLPGLYTREAIPTEAMLRIGHLPSYSNNPYVLAAATARFNDLLRQLAREEQVNLVDLDAWSRTAFVPREQYFFDSVHLTDDGQRMIGEYLATALSRVVSSAVSFSERRGATLYE